MPYLPQLARGVQALAKQQSAIGTPSYPSAGIDDLPIFADAGVPLAPRAEDISPAYALGTLSPRAPLRGMRTIEVSLAGPLMGSGSPGSSTGNGAAAINALIIAAGHKRTATATQITYVPASVTELVEAANGVLPATIAMRASGTRFIARDCVGSLTLRGNARDILRYEFRGRGIPDTNDTGNYPGYTGGVLRPIVGRGLTMRIARYAQQLSIISATAGSTTTFTCDGTITGFGSNSVVGISGLTGNWAAANGVWVVSSVSGATFTIGLNSTGFGTLTGNGVVGGSNPLQAAVSEFSFATGADISQIQDMTTADGLRRLLLGTRAPRLDVVLASDNDTSGAIAWPVWRTLQDTLDGVPWAVQIVAPGGSGNTWTIHCPMAVLSFDWGADGPIVTQRISAQLASAGPESEYVITVT